MSKYTLRVINADSIKKLVDVISHSECEANLSNGRGMVDAKSLIGAMSLDISTPLTLEIIGDKKDEERLLSEIKDILGEEVLETCL